MTEPSHLSIGEVLGLLQQEFPDVTISKIRFLESQGLIDPERTPSGYRKFYESDIERLRWILTQQREHFLPLKVIKDRLADGTLVPAGDGNPEAAGQGSPPPASGEGEIPTAGSDREPVAATVPDTPAVHVGVGEAPQGRSDAPQSAPQPIWMADLARAQTSEPPATGAPSRVDGRLDSGPSEVSLTARELAQAAGISLPALRELEQYGLVAGRPLGDDTYYDGDALLIASKAAAFVAHGIEARHLRMYKVAAEREAGFLEQVSMPMLKQRNPQARRDAVALVEELSTLGHDLRAALLRSKLRRHLDQG